MNTKYIRSFAALSLGLLSLQPLHADISAKSKTPIMEVLPLPKVDPTPWLYEGSDVPVDKSWTFGTLDNGVRYAVKHNDVPAGQVSIRVRIDAGALYENDDEQGFAHLMEHLTFRGSTFVPDGEAKRIWQRFGVSFGSDSNAETTPTQTVYKLDLPNAQPAALDESVKILAGMMREPRINEGSLNAERAIVLAELREGDNAQTKFIQAKISHFFQGQRAGNRSIIGTPATLQAATAEKMAAFHSRWYRPENAVVVMAGDVPVETLVGLVKRHFGDWTASGAVTPQPDFGLPAPGGAIAKSVIDPALEPLATIMFVRPWHKMKDTIAYNQQILIDLLAQRIINRRLEARARTGGNFLFARLDTDAFARSARYTNISITPLGDDWPEAVADVRSFIADALITPPSQGDIEREKKEFADATRTSLDSYRFESAAAQADSIVGAVDIRETVASPQTVLDVYNGMQDQFTPERLLAATRGILSGTAQRIVLASPKPVANSDVRLASALTAKVTPIHGGRLSSDNLGFDALPKLGAAGSVIKSDTIAAYNLERVEFANGTRALLSPNDAESGQIRMVVRFGRGYQAIAPRAAGPLWAGEMLLGENGVGKYTKTQIDQMIGGRRIELSFGIDSDAFEFSSTTRPDDLADQLKLIATKLEYPGWDPAPVARAKALAKQGYNGLEMSAMAVLQRDLQYLLSNKDGRWKSATPAEIEALTPAAFQKFWAPLLSTGPVEVSIFGDFNRDKAITALAQSFGAMKPRSESSLAIGAADRQFAAPFAGIARLTHKGPADQAAAVIAWPTGGGIDRITEGRQLEVLAAIFRDRLFEKFRAEQAVSYSPDMTSSWPEDFKNGGYLMAYSQVKPQDVDRFLHFAQEVAADMATQPVTADELQRAVEPIKQTIDRVVSGNTFWITQLKGSAFEPKKVEALGHLRSDYSKADAATIQALAKKYFRKDAEWKLTVLPYAAAVNAAAR